MTTPGSLVLVAALLVQDLPQLSFLGFRAGMPLPQATALINSVHGRLSCRTSSDPRIRECTGFIPERD